MTGTVGRCPDCDAEIGGVIPAGPVETPREGDVSVCLYCRSVAVFTGNGLEVRRPTETELEAYLSNPELTHAISVAAFVDTTTPTEFYGCPAHFDNVLVGPQKCWCGLDMIPRPTAWRR